MDAKTLIVKITETHYKVNSVDVRFNSRKGKWMVDAELSIRAMNDFLKFLKYGDPQVMQKRIEELKIEKQRIAGKLKDLLVADFFSKQKESFLLRKLNLILTELSEIKYSAIVYR